MKDFKIKDPKVTLYRSFEARHSAFFFLFAAPNWQKWRQFTKKNRDTSLRIYTTFYKNRTKLFITHKIFNLSRNESPNTLLKLPAGGVESPTDSP